MTKKDKDDDSAAVTLATHSMLVGVENSSDTGLDTLVEKMWDFDTLGIKVKEVSIYDRLKMT